MDELQFNRPEVEVNKAATTGELRQGRFDSVVGRVATSVINLNSPDDPDFSLDDYLKKNPAYAPFAESLAYAEPKSGDQTDRAYFDILQERNRMEQRRSAMAPSVFLDMILDETNLLPTFKILKGSTALARMGGATATGTGIEIANQSLSAVGSPTFRKEDAILSVAAATAGTAFFSIGAEIGGRVIADAANGAYFHSRDRNIELLAMGRLQDQNFNLAEQRKAARPFGALDNETLSGEITFHSRRITGLEESISGLQAKQANGTLIPDENKMLDNFIRARSESELAFNDRMTEKSLRLVDEASVDGVVDPYRLVANYNPIPNPYHKILQMVPESFGVKAYDGLNMLKKFVHDMASNQASITVGQRAGIPLRGSVWTNSITDRRLWANVRKVANDAYAEELGASKGTLMGQSTTDLKARVLGNNVTRTQYLNEAARKRVFNEQASSPQEARAMQAIDDFYRTFEDRRKETRQIGRLARVLEEIEVSSARIRNTQTKLNDAQANNAPKHIVDAYRTRLADQQEELALYQSAKDVYESAPEQAAASSESFMNRVYDIPAILRAPDRFRAIIADHFRAKGSVIEYNPQTKRMQRKDLTGMTQQEIDGAVERVFLKITDNDRLGVEGADFLDSLTSPARQLDIDNKTLWEFISHDQEFLMQKYTEANSANYHFSQMYNNRTPKQVWEEIEDQLIADGYSKEAIDEMRLNTGVLEDRVMRGTQLRDPARWDNRGANFLKQFTTLNYLVNSGVSSISEFGKIISEHAIGDVFKGLGRMFIDPEFRKAMGETKTEFGDANEIAMGAFHQTVSEGMSRQVNPDNLWGKINNANHILNMLGPVTEFFKTFEGAMRQHTLIDYMRKSLKGEATEFESAYLNRYNLSIQDMRNILDRAPIQQNGSFNLSNVGQWEVAGVAPESIQKFRSAVQSGISNTIVSATPADKPIFVDGVMFVRQSSLRNIPWAKNLPEDPKYKGYVRVESGVGTLPFQFQSVTMAGMNKTFGAYASGMVRNRYAGLYAGMALGYLTLWSKTPDFVWDEMSESDKFGRAFDYASIAPLFSTMAYDSMSTQQTLGQDPFIAGLFSPKFNQQPSLTDFATTYLGPASSSLVDVGRGIGSIMGGDIAGGASQLIDATPLIGTITIQTMLDQFKSIAN